MITYKSRHIMKDSVVKVIQEVHQKVVFAVVEKREENDKQRQY